MPNTYPHRQETEVTVDDVNHTLDRLLSMGARLIDPALRVAGSKQHEIIVNDERFIVTPNDSQYKIYSQVMEMADLPYVKNSAVLGDRRVIVGKIQRNARSLPQIMRSKQPRNGQTIYSVFRTIGAELSDIAALTQLTPLDGRLPLSQMLVLPTEAGRVLIMPPLDFEPVSHESAATLVGCIESELSLEFSTLGDLNLTDALKEGLYGGSR